MLEGDNDFHEVPSFDDIKTGARKALFQSPGIDNISFRLDEVALDTDASKEEAAAVSAEDDELAHEPVVDDIDQLLALCQQQDVRVHVFLYLIMCELTVVFFFFFSHWLP
jgi:hypothetical protein